MLLPTRATDPAEFGNTESAESATCRRFLALQCELHSVRIAAQWWAASSPFPTPVARGRVTMIMRHPPSAARRGAGATTLDGGDRCGWPRFTALASLTATAPCAVVLRTAIAAPIARRARSSSGRRSLICGARCLPRGSCRSNEYAREYSCQVRKCHAECPLPRAGHASACEHTVPRRPALGAFSDLTIFETPRRSCS